MTWLRSALFNLLFLGGTALGCLAALPLLLAPRRWFLAYLRAYAGVVLWLLRVVCGIRVRVTGEANLAAARQPGGGALVAAKHQSAFDTVIWLRLLPDAVYVLKQELLRLPVWGRLARHSGMIAVDRSAGAPALRAMVQAARTAVAEGRQVVIFPEGTRTAPGAPPAYQPGVAALAGALGVPVIPVATDSGCFWPRRGFRKRPGTITVAVLPPLPGGLPRAEFMRRLQAAIETESDRLRASVVGNPVENFVE
ncbi:1-acyl-sn-glycerol-3-phosphate acyltransferase [Roseomonas sp. NAR14]|uniref:1-acyl-sn-glycerol-3-phosphate acyltransferase n=1 Tax=Roseomonas acroporae TaxID=2937791 RepID=A0A9X2BVX9_9PROT|nr:lysophospholipid acyltransferase family protein [Roseomonas acroporae]MCK8787167.1 1-acyl-sn-glycerol-3-phosphate acyltransferase [Roseomonas acroporae]